MLCEPYLSQYKLKHTQNADLPYLYCKLLVCYQLVHFGDSMSTNYLHQANWIKHECSGDNNDMVFYCTLVEQLVGIIIKKLCIVFEFKLQDNNIKKFYRRWQSRLLFIYRTINMKALSKFWMPATNLYTVSALCMVNVSVCLPTLFTTCIFILPYSNGIHIHKIIPFKREQQYVNLLKLK